MGADVDTWTVRIVLERVPDCVELLDELAYLSPTLVPLDTHRCVLQLSVVGPDYEYAFEYADRRVRDVNHVANARLALELIEARKVATA